MVVQQIAERFHVEAEEIQLGKVILNISPDFNQIEFGVWCRQILLEKVLLK